MLVKRAAVGPSSIHGWGLIASRRIRRGQVVDESPILVTSQDVPRAFASHVYSLGGRRVAMPCGDGIFTNHDSVPNAAPKADLDRRVMVLVALREIRAGEEVTIDYDAAVEPYDSAASTG